MKEIAIIGYQQSDCVSDAGALNEVELIIPVIGRVFEQVGLNNAQDVDFVCSGSCDYLQGAAFAFVLGVDALGAVPPIKESHVEMDAAWALYESILVEPQFALFFLNKLLGRHNYIDDLYTLDPEVCGRSRTPYSERSPAVLTTEHTHFARAPTAAVPQSHVAQGVQGVG